LYEVLKSDIVLAGLVLVEALIYIIASLLLVFAVNFKVFGHREDIDDRVVEDIVRVSWFRVNAFKIAHVLTVFSTLLLVATILLKIGPRS
jgi:hypothetical protein